MIKAKENEQKMKVQEVFSIINFTPNGFFGTTSAANNNHHSPQLRKDLMPINSPKILPKLMEQRVEMPKKKKSKELITSNSGITKSLPNASSEGQQRMKKQQRNQQRSPMDNNVATTILATPRRTQPRVNNGFRHEHSSSITIPYKRTISAACIRNTPPATFASEDSDVMSVMFAGSRFIESPSAKSLPLPPLHWLGDQDERKKEVQEAEVYSSSSENEEFQSDFNAKGNNGNVPGNWFPIATNNTTPGTKSPSGVRMHPLRLIAAAMMST